MFIGLSQVGLMAHTNHWRIIGAFKYYTRYEKIIKYGLQKYI